MNVSQIVPQRIRNVSPAANERPRKLRESAETEQVIAARTASAWAHAASGALEGGKFRFQASIRNHRGPYTAMQGVAVCGW